MVEIFLYSFFSAGIFFRQGYLYCPARNKRSYNFLFFFRRNSPERKMLAILEDFGKDPEKAVMEIPEQVIATSAGDLVQKNI